MNVVDSSGWLEYLADGPNAGFFAPALEDAERLLVPAISVYEVFKRVRQQRGEDAALQAAAMMTRSRLIELDASLSIAAAIISMDHALPMADSIMLASAGAFNATLWTQDSDFQDIPGVRYIVKRN